MGARIAPQNVVQAVDQYVDTALHDAQRFSNSEPLDASGVWSLHKLAAEIYAIGWEDGERAEGERQLRQQQRDRKALDRDMGVDQ